MYQGSWADSPTPQTTVPSSELLATHSTLPTPFTQDRNLPQVLGSWQNGLSRSVGLPSFLCPPLSFLRSSFSIHPPSVPPFLPSSLH